MMELVPFLLVGVILFGLLVFLMRRKPRTEGASEALVEARLALNSLQDGILPSELVGRIFAKEDLQYVKAHAPEHAIEAFCADRRKIALAWIRQLSTQTRSLMRFHLGAARFYSRLNPSSEMGLALDFAMLLLNCKALEALVYVAGPYAAPRMVGKTALAADRVCKISEEALAFLSATRLGALSSPSVG